MAITNSATVAVVKAEDIGHNGDDSRQYRICLELRYIRTDDQLPAEEQDTLLFKTTRKIETIYDGDALTAALTELLPVMQADIDRYKVEQSVATNSTLLTQVDQLEAALVP